MKEDLRHVFVHGGYLVPVELNLPRTLIETRMFVLVLRSIWAEPNDS
jgi:hypothetical protein